MFQQILLEKAYVNVDFNVEITGPAMVRPWSGRPVLTFGKRPYILYVLPAFFCVAFLKIAVLKGFNNILLQLCIVQANCKLRF